MTHKSILAVGAFVAMAMAATGAISQPSAREGQSKVYARSGLWVIEEQNKFCQINLTLPAGGQLTFAKAARDDGYLRYRTNGKDALPVSRASDAPVVVLEFDSKRISGRSYTSVVYGPVKDDVSVGQAFRESRRLTIRSNDEVLAEISLAGSARAFAKLQQCAARWPDGSVPLAPPERSSMSVPTRPVIPEPDLKGPFRPNTPVAPIDPARWVTPSDYPSHAMRNDIEGVVRFTAHIGKDGRAKKCDVTHSSGDTILDQRTCTMVIQRGRFQPATDSNAALTESIWSSAVRWQIPRPMRSAPAVPPVPADRRDTDTDGDSGDQERTGKSEEGAVEAT